MAVSTRRSEFIPTPKKVGLKPGFNPTSDVGMNTDYKMARSITETRRRNAGLHLNAKRRDCSLGMNPADSQTLAYLELLTRRVRRC